MAVKKKRKWIIISCLIVLITLVLPVFLFNKEKFELNEKIRTALPGSFVQLPNGVVHYEHSGPVQARAIVLIHGFSVPYYIWDPTFNALAKAGFHVIRYDHYGRGYSDRPDVDYTINLLVTQLNNLLTALNIDQPVDLVVLSLGGPVAAGFFNSYPAKVHSFVFVDPLVAPVSPGKIFPLTIPVIGEYIMTVILAPFILPGSQTSDFYRPEHFPEWETKYRDQMQYKGFRKAILSTIRNTVNINAVPWYKAIGEKKLPVLLLWGEADKSVPYAEMMLLRQAIPEAEFYTIKEAGHIPHYEQSGIVNPLLIRFLTENQAAGPR